MTITGPCCEGTTPPTVTIGRSLTWWFSIPLTSTVRTGSVLDTIRTSEPAKPPLAPLSTRDAV